MVLYVVRHGETDFNVQGRYCGSSDVPLNKKGLEQAKKLAEELTGINFEIIIASSLIRAKQTGEIISKKSNIPLILSDEFKERNVGVYEGLTREEAKEKYPDLWNRNCTRELNDAPANGETILQFNERITNALLKLEKEYSGKNVLLITHGFASRIINRHYNSLSFDEMHGFSLGNCEIAKYII
jgi:probable phosphoglycerate mutase